MRLKIVHNFFLISVFVICPFIFLGQNKSTNIQTIDGKKYYIHKIEKSQSLYAISKLYNVSLDELYANNPDLKNGAKASQEIKIPAYNLPVQSTVITPTLSVDTNKYITHKVLKGETIYSISKKFNTSEKTLSSFNPLLTEGIKEGQLLILGEKNKKKNSPATTSKEQKNNVQVSTKEQREVKSTVLVKDIKPNSGNIDSTAFKPISKPRKNAYNVALILPLQLDATINIDLPELVKNNGNFPMVPGLSIDFYLGFKRALDSLAGKEFELHLEVYDIDEKDSLKLIELVANPSFKELDFIFGPFYANNFKIISKKAKELHIPLVSPIARQNKILFNNIYISKTNPSQFTLLDNLSDYCLDSLKNQNSNIILVQVNEKDKKELQFVNAFKKHYSEKLKTSGRGPKDSLMLVKGIAGLKNRISASSKNIIVMLSDNQVFAIDFITQLSMLADKKDVVLCGWESLASMDNIDQEYLNGLRFTFPYQFNLSNLGAYKLLSDNYKVQQESMPGDYFYIGFDIAYYYLYHLREKGPDFIHNLNSLPLETNYMNFKFTRPDNTTGFDNQGVYIFRYNSYQLQKTGWK